MKKRLWVGLCIFAQLFLCSIAEAAKDFPSYYHEQIGRGEKIVLSDTSVAQGKKIHFILVPGLFGRFGNVTDRIPVFLKDWLGFKHLSHFLPTYFKEFQTVIHEELHSTSSIFIRNWKLSIRENAELLAQEVLSQSEKKGGVEVELVGHSKGGIEVIQAAMSNPDVARLVRHVIAVQSPLAGISGIDRKEVRHPVSKLRHYVCDTICNQFLDRTDEFDPKALRKLWDETFKVAQPKDLDILHAKVFMLGSFIHPEKRTWLTSLIYRLSLHPLEEKSDGLVRDRDQILAFDQDHFPVDQVQPKIGRFVGFIDEDHCGSFLGGGLILDYQWHWPWKWLHWRRELTKLAEKRFQFSRIFLNYFLEGIYDEK